MKKISAILFIITPLLLSFSGCAAIGSKSASIAVVYGIMMLLALFMLIGYICIVQKKEAWLTVLFICIAVVNAGYFSLAVSSTIEEALLANRISYLGSVFLPISMLMVMLDLIKIKYEKWFSSILVSIGSVVFFIAASPGYLDIYYKEVTLITVNGVSSLDKLTVLLTGSCSSSCCISFLSCFIFCGNDRCCCLCREEKEVELNWPDDCFDKRVFGEYRSLVY